MEQPAPLRNKIRSIIWVAILLGSVYFFSQSKSIPYKWVNSNDPNLIHQNGYLYYNKKAFSGWLYADFANGVRERETPYYEGKEEGVMKSWYADKTLEQERLFINGKKEGTHRGWWPDGKPKFEYEFKNDEHNGVAKEWFNDNKVYRVFHYKNGREDGLQQLWWADGKVRANYVVKDGEQYGLIGRKFCKNVFKDETVKKSNTHFAVNYGLQ
jgi:antitoxin component YwqK of YwqJK toxin-antitoxin module